MARHELRVGCAGWNHDWRGALYTEDLPKRRWLEGYAERLDSVEVNSTFYGAPKEQAVTAWAEQVPDGFLFCCKISRYLTHIKRLADSPAKNFKLCEGVQRFFNAVEPLRAAGKLGPTLWQLPPNFKRDDARLEQALGLLPPGRHAFEFRHPSWYAEPVYAALRERDAALVIIDDPELAFPTREITASWTYVRFHRGSRGRGGDYSDAELATWRRRIGAWRSRIDVHAYFNNGTAAHAPLNALALRGRR